MVHGRDQLLRLLYGLINSIILRVWLTLNVSPQKGLNYILKFLILFPLESPFPQLRRLISLIF